MKLVFENVKARVLLHEEIIGQGQAIPPGAVVVESKDPEVIFAMTLESFRRLRPDAVYDPYTREFSDPD